MNKILLRVCNMIFSGILLSLLGTAKLPADVSPDATPQLRMQLATGAKLTLGEPVILHAEITNPLVGQKLWIQTGWYETGWYTLSLVDSAGHPVAALADTRTREARGALGPSLKIVSPDSAASLDIIATRFLPIPHPGKYLLKVHIQAPYAPEEVSAEKFSQVQHQLKSGETVLAGDFVFPLTVGAANPSVLQAKANALVQNIFTQTVGKSHDTDLDALFSMPEDAAATSWQRLADSGNADTQARVADHLANLHTSKATDILFKMLDNPNSNSFVSEKLAEVYNQGSPVLRDHIKSVAAQKGIALPEKISVLLVTD